MKLKHRGIIVHPEELTKDWIDRMAEAGLNTLGLHPTGGTDAHESLQRAIDAHILPQSRMLRAYANSLGIKVAYDAHAASWLLPRHLFGQQPDWFRMNEKGERVADFNLCASNPDGLAYIAERAALLASLLETGSHKYHYALDDVFGFNCFCASCRKYSASDQNLLIMNAMLTGLKKYDKKAQIIYSAYVDTLQVPQEVEPLAGVFLEYAPFHREHNYAICDPASAKNKHEVNSIRDLLSFFGKKNARVVDYWMDNSLFSGWVKPAKKLVLNEAVMGQDVAFYRELGFDDIASCGCYLGEDYDALYGKVSLEMYGQILAGA